MPWYCLKAQPKREHIAAASLRQLTGVDSFCPRIRFKKPTRRGSVWFVEALFPGYLFSEFEYPESHRAVRSAHGVVSIVHFGEQIPTLSGDAIEMLRRRHGEEAVITLQPELEVGDAVTVGAGTLAGLEAVITRLVPTRDRVRILLDFLGRQVEAEVDPDDLVPVDPIRKRLS